MRIEENNFAARKNLLDYDQVMNDQRDLVYKQRNRVLMGEDMHEQILNMIRDKIDECIEKTVPDDTEKELWDLPRLNELLLPVIPLPKITMLSLVEIKTKEQLKNTLTYYAIEIYNKLAEPLDDPAFFRNIERMILLRVIDSNWMRELSDMEMLKQSIGLQQYGQRNPVDEYKFISYDLMDEMNANIINDTLTSLYRIKIRRNEEPAENAA